MRTDPRRRGSRSEIRTGFLLIALLAGLATAVFYLDEILRGTQEGPRLVVVSESAPELAPGSPVWVAGRPVGRVLEVRFRSPGTAGAGNVVVRAVLNRGVAGIIRADATASIQPADLLEPVVLSIRPGSPEAPPFDFADTLRATADTLDQERAMALIDSLRASFADQRSRSDELRRAITRGGGTLAGIRRDTALRRSLLEGRRKMEVLGSERWSEGSLGLLLRDTVLGPSVKRIRARFARLAALRDSLRRPPPAGAEEALPALASLRRRIGDLEADLRAGRGTAGRALYDEEATRQLGLLRARLDSVVSELVFSPGRWLRFRLF